MFVSRGVWGYCNKFSCLNKFCTQKNRKKENSHVTFLCNIWVSIRLWNNDKGWTSMGAFRNLFWKKIPLNIFFIKNFLQKSFSKFFNFNFSGQNFKPKIFYQKFTSPCLCAWAISSSQYYNILHLIIKTNLTRLTASIFFCTSPWKWKHFSYTRSCHIRCTVMIINA